MRVLLPGLGVLLEGAHAARGEGVEAAARLALAQDRLAALEGQELEALDHRHHLVDGEVAEERAHDDLAPAARRGLAGAARPPGPAGRPGTPGRRCPRGPSARPRTARPTSARRPGPPRRPRRRRAARRLLLVLLLADVQEVVVLDPLVGTSAATQGRRGGRRVVAGAARRAASPPAASRRARTRGGAGRGRSGSEGRPARGRARGRGARSAGGARRRRRAPSRSRSRATASPSGSSAPGPPTSSIPIMPTDRGRDTAASRCLSSIWRARRSSTSRRPGSTFWTFFRTDTAFAAKPSRAYWSARGRRSATASCFLSARISTSASCMRRLGFAPFFWSWAFRISTARAYFFAAMRETTSSSFVFPKLIAKGASAYREED